MKASNYQSSKPDRPSEDGVLLERSRGLDINKNIKNPNNINSYGSSGHKALKKALGIMFDSQDNVCASENIYGTDLMSITELKDKIDAGENYQFIGVNPFKQDSSRKDENVSSYKNFIFEMDEVALDTQLKIIEASGIPVSLIVYSGGKSYHTFICLEEAVDKNKKDYQDTWKRIQLHLDETARGMGFEFSGSVVDSATKNPSRFARFPGGKRGSGVVQEIVDIRSKVPREDFENFLSTCPFLPMRRSVQVNHSKIETMEVKDRKDVLVFMSKLPRYVQNYLRTAPSWASESGMNPKIYEMGNRCVEYTHIDLGSLIYVFDELVIPSLESAGYDISKVYITLENVYMYGIGKELDHE